MAATSLPSSPPPSPACRQSRSRAHTAEPAAHCCNDLVTAPTMAASAAATSIVFTPTATAATPVTAPRPSLPQLPPPPRFCPCHHTNCPPAPRITRPPPPAPPPPTQYQFHLFKSQIYYFLCMNVTNLV